MPLYEYKCLKCGEVVESIQKFTDPPLKICSHCGGLVEKQISNPSFQFKGTGWYVTDYSRKRTETSQTKKEESTDAAETRSEDASKTKKDSSPAEKPPSPPSAN